MLSFFIILFAFLGLIDSGYIFYKKIKKERLICFVGNDCNKVIDSKYSSVFGIPNEALGILFYVGVFGFFLFSWIGIDVVFDIQFVLLFRVAVFLALISSIFLTAIQIFILKEWCEYCLFAAATNLAIFILVFLF